MLLLPCLVRSLFAERVGATQDSTTPQQPKPDRLLLLARCNFYFNPLHLRVFFQNLALVGWSSVLSSVDIIVAHGGDDQIGWLQQLLYYGSFPMLPLERQARGAWDR